jgi:putative nucleotidyltransferase with HDIG domain
LLKLAALLHDVGKPATCSVEPDGRVRFFSHEHLSAQITVEVLTRLRFSAQEVRLVSATVAQHMRPGFLIKEGPVSRRAIYHFFRDSGDASVDALMLSLADHLATRGAMLLLDHWRTHLEFVNLLLDNYYHRPAEAVSPPPLVTGRDVMKLLSISSGPQVGQLLEAVREAQVEGLVRTREEALQFLREQGLSVDPKST